MKPPRPASTLGAVRGAVVVGAALALAASAASAQPSYDCAKAEGQVQELICDDAALAALDRELADAWKKAMADFPEEERSTQRATQRGWIGGRDECWKSDDVAQCVRDEYETRITELQIKGGLVLVPDYVSFDCDSGGPLNATFYSNTKLPAVVLTWGDDQVIAYPARSGSGSKYEGRNVTYWEHQGEVSLTWLDREATCRKPGG